MRLRPLLLAALPLVASLALASPALAQDTTTTTPAAPKKPAPKKKPAPPPAEKKDEPKADEKKEDEKKAAALAGDPGDRPRAILFSFSGAFTRQDVGAFTNSLAFDKTGANGVTLDVGLGVRFNHLRGGARLRSNDTTEFTIWHALAEVGYELDIKSIPFKPLVIAHVGYAFKRDLETAVIQSQLPRNTLLPPKFSVNGAVLGAELGIDYHVVSYLHIEPFLGFDFLFMSRGRASVPRTSVGQPTPEEAARPLYTDSGSGLGYGFLAGLRGVFDVGF